MKQVLNRRREKGRKGSAKRRPRPLLCLAPLLPAVLPSLLPAVLPLVCHSRVPPPVIPAFHLLSFPQFLAGIQKKTTGYPDPLYHHVANRKKTMDSRLHGNDTRKDKHDAGRDRHDAGKDRHDAGKDRHTQGESKVAFSRAPAVFPALSLPCSTPCHSRAPLPVTPALHSLSLPRSTPCHSRAPPPVTPALHPLSFPRPTSCHSRAPPPVIPASHPLSFPQFLAGIQKKTTGHQDTPSQLIAARVTAFSFVH